MIGFNRQGVITSTITKRISSFSKNENSVSEKINEAISKYKRSNINYPAIVYGRDNEPLAVQDFFNDFKKKHHHARLENVGLKIDEKLKFFGGSVDGVLHCECQNCDNNFILEIKSPFRLKDQSVKKMAYTRIFNKRRKTENQSHILFPNTMLSWFIWF